MQPHQPVLLSKVVEILRPTPGQDFVDFTAGYGGHAQALLHMVGKSGYGYLFDRDPESVRYLKQKFSSQANVSIEQTDISSLDWQNDIPIVDMMLADLGVSSPQLDNTSRGFSFQGSAPLDMRMDPDSELTAYQIVNSYSEKTLADTIYQYGEEHASRKIAKAIVTARRVKPIETTDQLAEIISHVISKRGKIHPATKTFQALRIATNDELSQLQDLLGNFDTRLAPGGRIAIISFHSLEDRMVKQAFKKLCTDAKDEYGNTVATAIYKMVTKKPIIGLDEKDNNPRARSAKLRAVEKIN